MNKKYLTFGNVFRDTFSLLKSAGVKIFAAELAFLVPFVIPAIYFFTSGVGFDWDMEEMMAGVIISVLFCVIVGAITGPLFIFYSVKTLNNVATGIVETAKDTIKAGFKKILPFWGTYIVYGVIVSLSVLPMFVIIGISAGVSAILPGNGILTVIIMVIGVIGGYVLFFWIAIAFSYSFYILLLENKTIEESLKGSWELTKKRCGKIFLITFVSFLVFYIGIILIFALTGGAKMFIDGISGGDAMTFIDNFSESYVFWIIYFLFIFLIYPVVFAFYHSTYINLKKEKGTFHNNELVNDFMDDSNEEEELW